MSRNSDVKKSNFSAQTTLPETTYFDFVSNGQNFRISKANLLTALGVTGTIVQKGTSGLAILNKDGTVNEIRNLVGGPGTSISYNTEGGIEITQALYSGDAGSPILDESGDTYIIRNLVPGDGVSIAPSGDNLVVSVSGVPAASNVVIVNEMSDFPTAVDSVITLGDDSAYLISAHLSTANRFVMGNNTIVYAADARVSSITYTGTGNMFTSSNDTNKVGSLTCICATGTFLDWTGTPGGGHQFLLRDSVISAKTLGTCTDCDGFSAANVILNCTVDGFTFAGTNNFVSFSDFVSAISAGKLIDLGSSTNTAVSIRDGAVYSSSGSYILSGLADSGNIASGSLGNVINIRNLGTGSFTETIEAKDSLWEFFHNEGIADSVTSILALHAGGTITISTQDVPVIIGATWTYGHESRISGTSGGRWTYTGKGAHVNINGAITAECAAQTKNFTFYLYKNGVEIPNSDFVRALKAGDPGSIAVAWQEDLETDDYLELWVENNENTANCVINSIKMTVIG